MSAFARLLAHPWTGLAVGIVACSTSVIFIKESATPPLWLAAERLLLAALALAPLAWRDARREGATFGLAQLRLAWWPAFFLALHFATWIIGARLIPAANSTLIVNFTPVAMPLVVFVLLRERISARELLATAVGVAGVSALAAGDLDASVAYLHGDALCSLSMLALVVYLALARQLRRGSLWLYVVPLYAVAGVASAAVALAAEGPPPLPGPGEALLVLGLALVPTVVGHSLINRAMGQLRTQVVSLASLGSVPCAAVFGWLLWREVPSLLLVVAMLSYLVALALLLWPARRAAPAACPAAD